MNFLDLFSGIGGFALGLERAGHRTVAFCEIDEFCRDILRHHWPHVPCYGDIRELSAARLCADGIISRTAGGTNWRGIDGICGGFPCQDISLAGKGAGIAGSRSGLWSDFARLIGELRPRTVIVENVTALLNRGMGDVLRDLAAFGFDAEWHCIPASAVGAPHRRDRIWIVGHASQPRLEGHTGNGDDGNGPGRFAAQADGPVGTPSLFALADTAGNTAWSRQEAAQARDIGWGRRFGDCCGEVGRDWIAEPGVGRVAARVPHRVDRLHALGNAIVPQIAEVIGRTMTP